MTRGNTIRGREGGNKRRSSVHCRRLDSATRRPIFPIAGYWCSLAGTTSAGLSNELWTLSPSLAPVGPQLSSSNVVNAFSYQTAGVAPGEIVSIFGSGLGPQNGISFAFDPSTGTLPVSGPGVQVTWNGLPAPLYFAREDQLNVQVPYELSGAAQATLSVTVNGLTNSLPNIPVVAAAPGLAAVAFNVDLILNGPSNPAAKGSLVVIFATGEGIIVPASREHIQRAVRSN